MSAEQHPTLLVYYRPLAEKGEGAREIDTYNYDIWKVEKTEACS